MCAIPLTIYDSVGMHTDMRRRRVPERDERGERLTTKVTTAIWGDNYNWVVRRGLQFGAILDRAIQQYRAAINGTNLADMEYVGRKDLDRVQNQLRAWIAERNKNHELTSKEQVEAKLNELKLAAAEADNEL
jgi:hypothetical protein